MNIDQLIENVDSSRGEAAEFKRLAVEYCQLVNQFGFNVKPFRNTASLQFEKCTPKQKLRAITYLDINIHLLNESVASGENPLNSAQLLWRALKKIKGTPEADLFDKIEAEDVVEVYLDDHIQIFRNLQFFNYTSFTIDELLCGTWYKLYQRDVITKLKMFKMSIRILAGKLKKTTPWNVPEHIFLEVNSQENLKHSLLLKYLSPLTNHGKMVGAICTSKATFISKGLN